MRQKMNYYFRTVLFIGLSFSFFLTSCNESFQGNPAEDELQADYLSMIKQLGFDESSAIDMGDYFIVEGDIALDKAILPEYNFATRQARFDYIVGIPERYDIQVKIDSDVPAAWRTAFVSAIAEWNTFNGLKMKVASLAETSPDIRVFLQYTKEDYIALASPPDPDGKAGPTIKLNPSYINLFTEGQKKLIAVHELGHCIGLRHTNWMSNTFLGYPLESVAIGIPGTPNTGNNPDPNSIMNFDIVDKKTSWTEFSYYDQIAVNYLYPTTWIDKGNGRCEYQFSQKEVGMITGGSVIIDPPTLYFDVKFTITKNGSVYGVDLQSRNVECKNPDDLRYTIESCNVSNFVVTETSVTYKLEIVYYVPDLLRPGQTTPPLTRVVKDSKIVTTTIPKCYW